MAEYGTLIPVNVITGFLGSGKTTLLRKLLDSPQLANTAVLINEFGEVGLDHMLLERIDDETVVLQSGCVCCTIRSDLTDAIRELYGVKVKSVNVRPTPKKTRIVGRGRTIQKRDAVKKATITLEPGKTIDIYKFSKLK